MKLINCHHVKKRLGRFARQRLKWPRRPPDTIGGDGGGEEAGEKLCRVRSDCGKRTGGRRLARLLLPLTLMCLMFLSDFHHSRRQQIQRRYEIAANNQCAQYRSVGSETSGRILAAITPKATTTTTMTTTTSNKRSIESEDMTISNNWTTSDSRQIEHCGGGGGNPGGFFLFAEANSDANRLYEDLMMTYNRIVRPVANNSDRVVVKLSLKLSQLIDVNLKNQMMTTNVWLNQEWSDYKLKWDPVEYGGIEDINLPAEQIWLPDIVLYNSAEGYFAVSIMTKAKVRYDGQVTWNPPAIFRSSCQIDITYFPFDSQNCHLKFGSWTFGAKIDLRHINNSNSTIERGTDLSEYYQNVEWDIMQASAKRNVITYACCPDDEYPDVTFNFTLRRKPLFYTVNLILPCIGITILSFLVFYLPSDSGEKVTLTISILVSLIFFLSVLIETIPSTSLAMPLLGKYLVFTMILITVSVCATVCVLNIHFRTPSTHSMPAWVKRWLVDILPKYLFMNVPHYQSQQANILPEQLIYLHNQAYGSQYATQTPQLPQPQQPQSQSASQQQAGEWSANPRGEPAQVNGANPHRSATNAKSQFRLLEPSSLESETQKQQQLSISPTSLFLPYLQSEAARRLQMQRSRSSDREQKSISESAMAQQHQHHQQQQQQQVKISIKNTNCDNQPTTGNLPASGLGVQGNKQEASAAAADGSSSSGNSRARRKSKNSSLLSRLFSSGKSSSSSSKVAPSDHHAPTSAAAQTQDNIRTRLTSNQSHGDSNSSRHLQHDTSSSFEDADYQHHSHFQARASICSNNLWRIGPTRRCSLAVPTNNYPTYYRPNLTVQMAAAAVAQQTRSPTAHLHVAPPTRQELSTISGCVTGGHYHAHLQARDDGTPTSFSSSGGGGCTNSAQRLMPPPPPPQGSVLGALVAASASSLPVRPKTACHNMNPPQTSAGHIQQMCHRMDQYGVGRAVYSTVNQQSSKSAANPISGVSVGQQPDLPPPPPPLTGHSPAVGGQSQVTYPLVYGTHTIGHHPSGQLQRNQFIQQHQINHSGLVLNPANLADDSGGFASTLNRPPVAATSGHLHHHHHHVACHQTCSSLKTTTSNPSGQYTSSIRGPQPGGQFYNVSLNGNYRPPQQQGAADTRQYPSHDTRLQAATMFPRSRSTDHRLCTYAQNTRQPADHGQVYLHRRDILLNPQVQQHAPPLGLIYSGHGHANLASHGQAAQQSSTSSNTNQYCIQNPQSIGRALGQAYMQRLQRQPTIYSSTNLNDDRPSRSMQRSYQYLAAADVTQQQLQQRRCQSSFDNIRRSKSQSSLDKRARSTFNNECEECSYLRRTESRINLDSNKTRCQCPTSMGPCQARAMYYQPHQLEAGSLRCRNNQKFTNRLECCSNGAGHCHSSSKIAATCHSHPDCNASAQDQPLPPPPPPQLTSWDLMRLVNEVDKAIQNAMFIAQHIDNLDEFESVKENWKYIAMVIDRIFLIVFFFACIAGTVTIFGMVPWSNYTTDQPIDLQLTRLLALNLTDGEPYLRQCP